MKSSLSILGISALAICLTTACTRMKVDSNVPGATVVWSADGLEPFQPWPPNSFEWRRSSPATTPFSTVGQFGNSFFITVEKDGYLRPLPQLVELYGTRRERVFFQLVESADAFERRMREQGFVLYRGEWVDPVENDLVVVDGIVLPREEAFRRQQIAQGLVEFDGRWMTREERDVLFAEQQSARGLVLFKDRWVTEEVRDFEIAIDEEVAAIAAEKDFADLPTPRVLGPHANAGALMQLYNSTGQRIRILFSGPVSREFSLDPFRSTGVRAEDRILLPAGRYEIAIIPTGLDAAGRDLRELIGTFDITQAVELSRLPLWGSWPFADGIQYSLNYTGSEQDLEETLRLYEIPNPNIEVNPPRIDTPDIQLPARPQRPQGAGGPPGGGGGRPPAP